MGDSNKRIETKLIHSGEPQPRILGSVMMPIFQSAMYECREELDYHNIQYIRLSNTPNHEALHKKLKDLENAEAALVTTSGMAAISTTILALMSSGDHLLAQDCLYGGTHNFITQDLPAFKIDFDFFKGDDLSRLEGKLKKNTKAILVETMTNPLLQVADLKEIVQFAKDHGLISIIDNTIASPINFRPAEWGFDLSLQSGTKYLNGHSDLVAGAVIGKEDLVRKITRKLNHFGGSLDPHAAFLLHRGLKTLAVRMRFQNESTLKISNFLQKHPKVSKVNYPGLEDNPYHTLAKELFDGFSGVLSFQLQGGQKASARFIEKTTLPIQAPSLGGIETLITQPAKTSHGGIKPEERKCLGISDDLIRISVGVEATEDLIEDFEKALSTI